MSEVVRPITIHEPQRHSLPPLQRYMTNLWSRRVFGIAMARASVRAAHLNTGLGQIWTVLNPMLLAGIYFLVFGLILGGRRGDPTYLAQLLGGLFLFYYTRNCIMGGSRSVTGQINLVTSTTIPRALLPLSAIVGATLTLGPMLLVYAMFHLLGGLPISPALLVVPLLLLVQTVFNAGVGLGLAALTVMYRDITQGLPYVLRIWLYLSPVLYRVEDFVERIPAGWRWAIHINPLVSIMNTYQAVLLDGVLPRMADFLIMVAWSIIALVAGSYYFLTREREFAIRF